MCVYVVTSTLVVVLRLPTPGKKCPQFRPNIRCRLCDSVAIHIPRSRYVDFRFWRVIRRCEAPALPISHENRRFVSQRSPKRLLFSGGKVAKSGYVPVKYAAARGSLLPPTVMTCRIHHFKYKTPHVLNTQLLVFDANIIVLKRDKSHHFYSHRLHPTPVRHLLGYEIHRCSIENLSF